MEAIVKSGWPKTANLASAAISLALVFGGAAAHAGGLDGFADSSLAGLIGDISQADLEQLEQASTADVTMARLVADTAGDGAARRPRTFSVVRDSSATPVEADLFPHSGRLLPLLVVRPEAAREVAVQGPAPIRPGVAQPVGVPRSRLRSATQAGRTGL